MKKSNKNISNLNIRIEFKNPLFLIVKEKIKRIEPLLSVLEYVKINKLILNTTSM